MDNQAVGQVFVSLSSPQRLDICRLLVKNSASGLVAGEIAAAMELSASNLSFHLKILTQSGLITVEQQGRFLRYRANPGRVVELVNYLTVELCPLSTGSTLSG